MQPVPPDALASGSISLDIRDIRNIRNIRSTLGLGSARPSVLRHVAMLGYPGRSRMQDTPPNAVELVKKYGRTSVSFQTLSRGMHHWFEPDACVGYACTAGAWVGVGSPIAAESREIAVMERFAAAARRQGKRVCFFAIERDVAGRSAFATMHIGDQPVWDPGVWPSGLRKKLKGQIRRANAKGSIRVRIASGAELSDTSSSTHHGVEDIISRWLQSRRMAPMGFLVQIDPFHLAEERRFFLAEHQGRIVAALIAIPIYARDGWFFDEVLRAPDAPNGTVEVLFDFAMRTFAEDKVAYVTFGLSPLSGVHSPVMREIRDHTRFLYNFKGLHNFKAKLGPQYWQPIYLAYPKHEPSVIAVYDALSAFTPRGPVRFAVDSLGVRFGRLARPHRR